MKKFIVAILFFTYQCGAMEKTDEIQPRKTFLVTIHRDFYPSFVNCLKTNKAVDGICGDFPLYKNWCTVHIVTKKMMHPDKNMDRFHHAIAQKNIGKNAKRKLKNIIAAYQELNDYRLRQHIFLGDNGAIHMIDGWRSVFCPDIMEYFYNLADDLPKLCAIAQLKYNL